MTIGLWFGGSVLVVTGIVMFVFENVSEVDRVTCVTILSAVSFAVGLVMLAYAAAAE